MSSLRHDRQGAASAAAAIIQCLPQSKQAICCQLVLSRMAHSSHGLPCNARLGRVQLRCVGRDPGSKRGPPWPCAQTAALREAAGCETSCTSQALSLSRPYPDMQTADWQTGHQRMSTPCAVQRSASDQASSRPVHSCTGALQQSAPETRHQDATGCHNELPLGRMSLRACLKRRLARREASRTAAPLLLLEVGTLGPPCPSGNVSGSTSSLGASAASSTGLPHIPSLLRIAMLQCCSWWMQSGSATLGRSAAAPAPSAYLLPPQLACQASWLIAD